MVYNEHTSENIHTNELKLIISLPLLKYLIYSSFFYLPHFHRPLGLSQQTETQDSLLTTLTTGSITSGFN